MTFTQLLDGYCAYLKPKPSWKNYCNLHQQFFKDWTAHPTFTQVDVWHRSLSQTPEQANKALSFLKAMYAWGLRSGQHTGLNFAVGVKAYSSQSRERMMDSFEVARVLAALDAMPPTPSALLVVLLTTGCRLSEALKMEPAHVNLLTGQWTQYQTKNKRTHITYLPTQARQALSQLTPGRQFYFESRDPGRMYTVDNAEKAWNKVRKDLQLEDVRLHDFRRTWSTHCYRATKDLALVKRCINHVSKDVTMVYVRFTFDEIRAVMQAQADRFFALEAPPPLAAVVTYDPPKRKRIQPARPTALAPPEPTPNQAACLPLAEAEQTGPAPSVPPLAAPPDETPAKPLSGREREVLVWVAQGQSAIDIGAQLGISPKTVATYRERLRDKLHLKNTFQLIRYALEHETELTMPVPAPLTPPPVSAPAVVVPMMSAPVPIVHWSHSMEREEWPG